jgi:hypothetical protein
MAQRPGLAKYADGSAADQRVCQQGSTMVSLLHGNLYEQAVRRNLFFSHCIARATSLPATAMVGNIVWNPPDSGVNLAMVRWASMVYASSATCTGFSLAVGYQATNPTGLTVADANGSTYITLSGAANNVFVKGKALAYAIATLLIAPVPVWLLHHNTAGIATTGEDNQHGELNGAFIIPPGGVVCIAAHGAAAAATSHTSSLMWEEIPLV